MICTSAGIKQVFQLQILSLGLRKRPDMLRSLDAIRLPLFLTIQPIVNAPKDVRYPKPISEATVTKLLQAY